jgi:cytochrome c biogenesis protein CcmG/thiol:disulfide interchange protein DsbE
MNWRRAAIAAALTVPIIALFKQGLTRDPRQIDSPLPGRPAPAFALPVFAPGQPPLNRAIDDTINLATLRGRVVVLNFWASWCLACRDEHAGLSEVAREYAGQPVSFVGALYQDSPSNGTKWIAEMGGQSYPSVVDRGARTAIDYGLYGVPETFIVGRDGRIALKITGPAATWVVKRVVDSLLVVQPAENGPR